MFTKLDKVRPTEIFVVSFIVVSFRSLCKRFFDMLNNILSRKFILCQFSYFFLHVQQIFSIYSLQIFYSFVLIVFDQCFRR